MLSSPIANNPFALMMDPEAVLRALESSDRLSRLQSRICRPLDKPLIARVGAEVAEFDRTVDNIELPADE